MLRRRFVFPKKPRSKPLPLKTVLFISFIIFIILNMISLWVIESAVKPILLNIAKTEIRGIAIEAINESIEKNFEKINSNELIIFHKHDNKITYSTNSKVYNRFITQTTKEIQSRLGYKKKQIYESENIRLGDNEFDSVVYYIPLGVVTKNTILANLGPKIPLEIALVGDVEPKFETSVKDLGINNIYLELFVTFKVVIQIVIPFATKIEPIETRVRLDDLLIPGEIPKYYGDDGGNLPNPTIMEEKE